MSIIIRLQNLPWTANSLDIRRYFSGLTIPDGGVHIVGGEKGDAFIAFSSDEDARQAMSRDGGAIKDAKIKLLLSSRNEMKQVVDQARNSLAAAAAASDASKKLTLQHHQQLTAASSASNVPTSHQLTAPAIGNLGASNIPSSLSQAGNLMSGPHVGIANANNGGGTGLGGITTSAGNAGMQMQMLNNTGGNSYGTGLSSNLLVSGVNAGPGVNHVTSRGNARARSRSPIGRMTNVNAGGELSQLQPMGGLMPMNGNLNQGPYAQGPGGQENWSRRVDFNNSSNNNNNSSNNPGIAPNNSIEQANIGSWRVELRGLPFNVTPRDIQEFFRIGIGLYVSEDRIRILVNDRGFTTGGATIRFDTEADFKTALTLSGQTFADRQIDVMPLLDDSMISQGNNLPNNIVVPPQSQQVPLQQQLQPPQAQLPQRDYVIYMKGIPFNMCTDRDVMNFFNGLSVTEVVFEFDKRTGKTAGNAYVEFPTKQDYENALELNLRHMGRRYIEVFPTTRDDMEDARRIGFQVTRGPVPGMNSTIPKPNNFVPNRNVVDDVSSKPTYCINITGLPPTITNADLTEYFKKAGALPFGIHIMLKGNGFNAGEAFLEFLSQEHQRIALARDGDVIGDHRIAVKDVPFNVMTRIVGRPVNPPLGPTAGGLPPAPGSNNSTGGGSPMMGGNSFGNNRGVGNGGGGFNDGGGNLRGSGGGGFKGHRFNGPRGGMRGGLGGNGAGMAGGMNEDGRGMSPGRNPRMNRDAFSDGRCVLHASNVPYKGTNEDLREFFADFNVLPNGIERRLNERGMATPEARIAFRTSQEAERAVKVMHKKTLLGRQIFLRLAV